jgi:hypothetical protein
VVWRERIAIISVAHAGISHHVSQRSKKDCAIATVAMVANLPYEEIAEQSPVKIGTSGMYPQEVHHLLVAATGVPWQWPRYGWLRPIARLTTMSNSAVVVIRRPWRWQTLHYVVIQDRWIHDPGFPRGYRVHEYPRRHWRTLWVHRPESDLRLLFVQHFRS